MTDILSLLVQQMEKVENDYQKRGLTGEVKKAEVLYLMELIVVQKWGQSVWEKYEPLLPYLIDFIVSISKNEIVLKLNQDIHKIWKRCC